MARNVTFDSRLGSSRSRSRSSGLGRERRGSGLKLVLAVLALVLVGLLVAVALQPAAFRISRSATMQAPVSAVFAQVNDFHDWTAWNPWQKLDPAAKNTYSGPTSGVGSVFEWDGNDEVGAGRMTIVESRPDDLIRIKLEFFRPMEATSTAEFVFQPAGPQSTTVTWSMFGENGFLGKAFGLFMDMDRMLGSQFDKGLADLKAIVEKKPRP